MGGEYEAPIGRVLWDAVQAIRREFDEELARAGGSRPVWFILLALCSREVASQREVAEIVGIQDATLTHHLAAMEQEGLIRRYRAPENRRVHRIELTEAGRALFGSLRAAATGFDERMREGLKEADIALFRSTLDRFVANVVGPAATAKEPMET